MALDKWRYDTNPVEDTGWTEDGIGDYAYRELIHTGKAKFGMNQAGGQRIFLVDFNNAGKFIDDLLGYGRWNGAGTAINRVLPDLHPLYRNFYATSADVEPWGQYDVDESIAGEGIYKTPFMKITAEYAPVDYHVLDDESVSSEQSRFITFKYGYQAQFLTLSGGMVFEQTGQLLNAQPTIRSQVQQFSMLWHQVPPDPADVFKVPTNDKILALQGTLNNATFNGFSAGTVLFLGADPVLNRPALGDALGYSNLYSWDITYNFQVKDEGASIYSEEAGWQYVLDIKNNRFDRVRSKIGNNLAYETGDFSQLFSIA